MPVYDYECKDCGPFTFMRPMAECDRPARCPECGGKAPRAFLNAPYFAMPAERSRAYAASEQSGNASGFMSEADGGAHNVGCGCCAPTPAFQHASTRAKSRAKGKTKTSAKTAGKRLAGAARR
jgi:putative FmdB family regulatory protein